MPSKQQVLGTGLSMSRNTWVWRVSLQLKWEKVPFASILCSNQEKYNTSITSEHHLATSKAV